MPNVILRINHPVTQDDIEVDVEFTVTPEEPDVGIMSWGIEDEHICSPNEDLNSKITEAGWEIIRQKIYDCFDPYDDEPDCDER